MQQASEREQSLFFFFLEHIRDVFNLICFLKKVIFKLFWSHKRSCQTILKGWRSQSLLGFPSPSRRMTLEPLINASLYTDGPTDGPTDVPTDGPTDVPEQVIGSWTGAMSLN